jgi:hypothetical protein
VTPRSDRLPTHSGCEPNGTRALAP